ncbi:MAG: hypothetical protein QXF80_07350, partial [Thermoplasmatales archaeon]
FYLRLFEWKETYFIRLFGKVVFYPDLPSGSTTRGSLSIIWIYQGVESPGSTTRGGGSTPWFYHLD